MAFVRDVGGALLDLAMPTSCVGCGSVSAVWCARCRRWDGPVRVRHGDLPIVAAASYGGPVRDAVLHYKERGRRDLARPLARGLGLAVATVLHDARVPPGRVVLVGVPSARSAAAARGGDHVARLVRRAAAATGARPAVGVLRLVRAVRDSAGLRSQQRAANLHRAMRAAHEHPARRRCRVILVDDVVTSGATLVEAHRALRAAGWSVAGAAVVAATPLRLLDGPVAGSPRLLAAAGAERPMPPERTSATPQRVLGEPIGSSWVGGLASG